jgi:hypothetical protein
MVLTAEQHSNLATHFDKLAEDDRALPEQKAAFVRRANWHRMLSRIAAERGDRALCVEQPRVGDTSGSSRTELLFSPKRLWAMRPKEQFSIANGDKEKPRPRS